MRKDRVAELGGGIILRVLMSAQCFPPHRFSHSSRWAWLTAHLAERSHHEEVTREIPELAVG